MEELRPCPFCGSDDLDYYYTDRRAAIICQHCEAEGPYSEYKTKEKAAVLWNCRAENRPNNEKDGR